MAWPQLVVGCADHTAANVAPADPRGDLDHGQTAPAIDDRAEALSPSARDPAPAEPPRS